MLRGIHADVAPKAMGVGLEAIFFIEMSKHERGVIDRFLEEVVDIPEVRSAYLVTGPHDFIVHVVARDMQHLKDVVLGRFTNRAEVTRIESSIIFEARVRHELPVLTRRRFSKGTGHERRPRSRRVFFARLDYADLPAQTTDYAAMLIASTLASAACGRGIDSAVILQGHGAGKSAAATRIRLRCGSTTGRSCRRPRRRRSSRGG